MIPKRVWLAATVSLLAASTATLAASSAHFVSWSGTTMNLASGEFADILATGGHVFSSTDMDTVNAALQADGIQTQGRISIMLAETAAGLSVLTMFDGVEIPDPPGTPTTVATTAFIPQTASWQYNIDAGGTFDAFPVGNELRLTGSFQWDSGVNSEALAVSSLVEDDAGSLFLNQFVQGGLPTNCAIQVLTSQAGVWSIVESLDFLPSDSGGPDFEYLTFEITAIPTPTGLLLLALAGGCGRRRRRH